MSNIVQVQNYFANESNLQRIQEACESVKINSQVMDVCQVIAKTPKLQSCSPASIVGSVITASRLGVSLDPNMKHAYLIPYGKECKLEISYMGMIDVVGNASGIRIEAREVKDCDLFELELGDNKKLTHKPEPFKSGEVIGYYAKATFPDGSWDIECMDMEEVEKCKKDSKGGTVWNTWRGEMAKKSVIRRLIKRLPKTRETAAITSYDEKISTNQDVSEFYDIEGVEVPQEPTATEQLEELI